MFFLYIIVSSKAWNDDDNTTMSLKLGTFNNNIRQLTVIFLMFQFQGFIFQYLIGYQLKLRFEKKNNIMQVSKITLFIYL